MSCPSRAPPSNEEASSGKTAPAPREAPFPDMVWIPGGTYWIGSDNHYPEEKPAHQVTVTGFWMDIHGSGHIGFRCIVRPPFQ